MKDIYTNPALNDTMDIWQMQMVHYGTQDHRKEKKFCRRMYENDICRSSEHRSLFQSQDTYLKVRVSGTAENSCVVFETFRDLSGKKKIKDRPGSFLLDDVLSELDTAADTCLLDSIHDIQTMITCTGLDDFVDQFHINKSVLGDKQVFYCKSDINYL